MTAEKHSTLTSILSGLILLLLLSPQQLLSQHQSRPEIDSLILKADAIRYQNFLASDSLYETASRKILAIGIENDPALWIRLLHQRTNAALFHSKLSLVKKYLADAYSSVAKYKDLSRSIADSLKAQTQVLESNYFYVISSYGSALTNLNEAEAFFSSQKQTPQACATLFQILQFQASIYQLQGELESSIDRYLASVQYYDCHLENNKYPNYILIHRNIGVAYSKMGNVALARKYFFSAKTNLDTCPETSRDFTIRNHALVLYNSIAEFYSTQKKIDSAKYFYNQALPIVSANVNYVSRVNEGLGKVALAEKDYASAKEFLTKSLTQTIQYRGEKNYLTANLYRHLSSLYAEKQDSKNSLRYLQKALSSLSSSEKLDTNNYTQNPSLSSLSIQKQTVITLHQKATTLIDLYKKSTSKDFLFAARNTNLLAIQFIDSTRTEFNLDKDKVVLGEEAANIYQTGLYLSSLLYSLTNEPQYLSECFELIDKSKSVILTDHIKLVKNFAGVPEALLDRQRELKVELSAAEQQLYSAEKKKEETSSQRQQFGEIKKAYASLLNDIKVAAPNYYKLRIENKNMSLAEARNMLAQDEALVEYFLSDSVLYTIVVTKGGSKIYTTNIDSLREQVEALRKLLTSPRKFTNSDFQTEWNERMEYLHQKLISPWIESLATTKRIIIVPHGVLNYLPFEMLPGKTSGEVLINSVAISYASSANLLREQKQMKATGSFFAGFNADYSNQNELPQLTGASSEVNSIKDIFGFRSALFSAATADDFRKEASQYKIIHLALHSLVNDEKPMFSRLVFTQTGNEGADITANELYSMELNAEIAVLSACETGLGKLHRGEGMMSLSRAFMYAGVPSTVISLWKVPDQSASILMKKFYQFLKNGERKDEALRLAKLEFIEDHPEMSHPFFWAGFIVNGKTDPVSLSYFSSREVLVITTLLAFFVITLFVVLRKRRRATSPAV